MSLGFQPLQMFGPVAKLKSGQLRTFILGREGGLEKFKINNKFDWPVEMRKWTDRLLGISEFKIKQIAESPKRK
jgi:hypothetical protein